MAEFACGAVAGIALVAMVVVLVVAWKIPEDSTVPGD